LSESPQLSANYSFNQQYSPIAPFPTPNSQLPEAGVRWTLSRPLRKRIPEAGGVFETEPHTQGKEQRRYNQRNEVGAAEGAVVVPGSPAVFAETPQFHSAADCVDAFNRGEDEGEQDGGRSLKAF